MERRVTGWKFSPDGILAKMRKNALFRLRAFDRAGHFQRRVLWVSQTNMKRPPVGHSGGLPVTDSIHWAAVRRGSVAQSPWAALQGRRCVAVTAGRARRDYRCQYPDESRRPGQPCRQALIRFYRTSSSRPSTCCTASNVSRNARYSTIRLS